MHKLIDYRMRPIWDKHGNLFHNWDGVDFKLFCQMSLVIFKGILSDPGNDELYPPIINGSREYKPKRRPMMEMWYDIKCGTLLIYSLRRKLLKYIATLQKDQLDVETIDKLGPDYKDIHDLIRTNFNVSGA
jgi:hypothetical protein